jgi:CDGSH-type Zn-finger protein
MEDPVIAQRAPIPVEVEAGQSYFWCACGKSAAQPFCDGTNKDACAPVEYTAAEAGTVYFCACKHTQNAPLCDGSHKSLPED